MSSSINIKKQFLKDLKNKSLDSINVMSICDELKIKRQTFYYHFRDIYDLGESILNDYMEELISDNVNTRYYLTNIFDFINDNYYLFYSFANFGLKDPTYNFIYNLMLPYVSNIINNLENILILNNDTINELINYYTSSITLNIVNLFKKDDLLVVDHVINKIEIYLDKENLNKTVTLFYERRMEI